jgi:hypothetical protein
VLAGVDHELGEGQELVGDEPAKVVLLRVVVVRLVEAAEPEAGAEVVGRADRSEGGVVELAARGPVAAPGEVARDGEAPDAAGQRRRIPDVPSSSAVTG